MRSGESRNSLRATRSQPERLARIERREFRRQVAYQVLVTFRSAPEVLASSAEAFRADRPRCQRRRHAYSAELTIWMSRIFQLPGQPREAKRRRRPL